MFHEVPCRCGDRKKRFKMDIGEFYVDECCSKKGFDHLGNPPPLAEGESVSDVDSAVLDAVVQQTATIVHNTAPQQSIKQKPSSASFLKSLIGMKPGRGKLRDMNRDQLVKMAIDKGLEVKEGVTKNELIALLLA